MTSVDSLNSQSSSWHRAKLLLRISWGSYSWLGAATGVLAAVLIHYSLRVTGLMIIIHDYTGHAFAVSSLLPSHHGGFLISPSWLSALPPLSIAAGGLIDGIPFGELPIGIAACYLIPLWAMWQTQRISSLNLWNTLEQAPVSGKMIALLGTLVTCIPFWIAVIIWLGCTLLADLKANSSPFLLFWLAFSITQSVIGSSIGSVLQRRKLPYVLGAVVVVVLPVVSFSIAELVNIPVWQSIICISGITALIGVQFAASTQEHDRSCNKARAVS